MKLNLGCGLQQRAGYVNIDANADCCPDIIHDLEQVPWLLPGNEIMPDASVDEIIAHHVLEHLGQAPQVFLAIMKEMYRILKPNATLEVRIPSVHSDGYWNDPTHVRPLTPQTFELFSKRLNIASQANNWPNSPLALAHDIDFEISSIEYNLVPPWADHYANGQITKDKLDIALATYRNVVQEIKITMYKVGPSALDST
jgi:SAM-dependent methyltransferase